MGEKRRIRKDSSDGTGDLGPPRNALKWQRAKDYAASLGRAGDYPFVLQTFNMLNLLPAYKSIALKSSSRKLPKVLLPVRVQKSLGRRMKLAFGGQQAGTSVPVESFTASRDILRRAQQDRPSPSRQVASLHEAIHDLPWGAAKKAQVLKRLEQGFTASRSVADAQAYALKAAALAGGLTKEMCQEVADRVGYLKSFQSAAQRP
jgi:hypothetical protein